MSLSHIFPISGQFISNTLKLWKKNQYENIEIQGDGIYGILSFMNDDNKKIDIIIKSINELIMKIEQLYEKYNLKSKISLFYGKEYYSAFGSNDNNKTISFFGNVVSLSKKMNDLAMDGKICIAKAKFNKNIYKKILDNLPKNGEELYLKNGKKIGLVYLIKWNNTF